MDWRMLAKSAGIGVLLTVGLWLVTGSDSSLGFGIVSAYVEYKIENIKKKIFAIS